MTGPAQPKPWLKDLPPLERATALMATAGVAGLRDRIAEAISDAVGSALSAEREKAAERRRIGAIGRKGSAPWIGDMPSDERAFALTRAIAAGGQWGEKIEQAIDDAVGRAVVGRKMAPAGGADASVDTGMAHPPPTPNASLRLACLQVAAPGFPLSNHLHIRRLCEFGDRLYRYTMTGQLPPEPEAEEHDR